VIAGTLTALILFFDAAALVPLPPDVLVHGEEAMVDHAVDGTTLVLEDGREVRLAAIETPVPAAALPGLEEMIRGRHVSLHYDGARSDRWRRIVAHVVRDDGLWLQGVMLRRGMARVHSLADNRQLVPEMLALEAEARAAGFGLWNDARFKVRSPEEAAGRLNSFQIVEGKVLAAENVRGRVYLNFGPDWKTDFTVLVPPKVRRQFEKAGRDLTVLAGGMVRVRGWVVSWNGPMIELTHAEQLEILDALD